MQPKNRSKEVVAYPERCAGCMSCALACSWTFTGLFNPLKSRIIINYPGDVQRKIIFARDCNNCGICVEYCNFGALEMVGE